jgi:hypothetical protein
MVYSRGFIFKAKLQGYKLDNYNNQYLIDCVSADGICVDVVARGGGLCPPIFAKALLV